MKSDKELIDAYHAGDEQALHQLFERHLNGVFRFAYRYVKNTPDAEDITQDTFIKAWKGIRRFDNSKKFTTWLFTITRNTALDLLKKKKSLAFSDFENDWGENVLMETITDDKPLPVELSIFREEAAALQGVVKTLPKDYQTVLHLRYSEDLTFEDIAEVMGRPMNTVKSWHRRALLALREIFQTGAPKNLRASYNDQQI